MRDLIFKNLTSSDRKRRVLSSYEVLEEEGLRSRIRRHFICIMREFTDKQEGRRPLPVLRIVKERNNKEQREKFFCMIKNSVYTINNKKAYLILFMHTLRIDFTVVPEHSLK